MNTAATALKEPSPAPALFEPRGKAPSRPDRRPWKLLIVDDEPEVHSVTRLALSDFRFDGRGLEFISAHSGAEACEIAANDPEIAVMLLDVVMETDDAGLQVVRYVRQTLGNSFIRIILRTGHPGLAPERAVIRAYDINDYRAKTELTQDRMFSLMYTSLAGYQRLITLAHSRRYLATLADEYRHVLDSLAARLYLPVEEIGESVTRLQAVLGEEVSDEAQHELQEIQGHRILIEGVLRALGRLAHVAEHGDIAADFEADAAFEEVRERLRPLIEARHAEIRVEPLPSLHGHRKLFIDLLEQLVNNAIQYQDGDAPQVEVSVASSGKNWEFCIADRGVGVPPDRTEDIFRSFAQFDAEHATEQGGIGLALCRKIVALHGGKIWVERRPGGGSLFKFTLPAGGSPHGGG